MERGKNQDAKIAFSSDVQLAVPNGKLDIIAKNGITLEVNRLKPNHSSTEHALGVFFHEATHLMFMKSQILNLIKKCLTDNRINSNQKFFPEKVNALTFVIEVIIESLVPNGYIGTEYLHYTRKALNNPSKPVNLNQFIRITADKMSDLAKQYIDSSKSIDENFIDYIISELKGANNY